MHCCAQGRVAGVVIRSTVRRISLLVSLFGCASGQQLLLRGNSMKAFAITALLGCAAAITPVVSFTGGAASLAATSSLRQRDAKRRGAASSVQMMAIDPATVHSVGDYVNAVGSSGLDQAWLSHVMHGE